MKALALALLALLIVHHAIREPRLPRKNTGESGWFVVHENGGGV